MVLASMQPLQVLVAASKSISSKALKVSVYMLMLYSTR